MCAVAWKTKTSMRHLTGKSTLTHKCSALNPFSLATSIEPLTVPPQKVAETDSSWATGDTHQSKVFYNNEYFFVFFVNDLIDTTHRKAYYATSDFGYDWDVKPFPVIAGVEYMYQGQAGNLDVYLRDKSRCYFGWVFNRVAPYSARGDISGTTFTRSLLWGYSESGIYVIKSKLNLRLDGKFYTLVHRSDYKLDCLYVPDPWAVGTCYILIEKGGLGWSENSGGVQLLNYKTSSPYDMLALVKQGTDNMLYSAILYENITLSSLFPIAVLTNGFSSFCACSEAQDVGDTEIIDIVYIKSTGELAHKSFLNDELTDETILCESGASYPVIACGKGGRRYVRYVKDGEIKQQKLRNLNGIIQILTPEEKLFPEHTYNNPAYLSTNQNVQHGQICLVWTEGASAPYEVWFCTIGD